MKEAELDIIWKKLNGEEYLVLRNADSIKEELKNGGDIDILCKSKKIIIDILDAVPRFNKFGDNVYNYYTTINGMSIPIDIREIGDNYYSEKWENNMLENRKKYRDYYILRSDEYAYSLLYHILIHKSCIPQKYFKFLKDRFDSIDTVVLLNILSDYLKERGYLPVIPNDTGVDFNLQNYELLLTIM